MVNTCANPLCGKMLHYLREGQIFLFSMPDRNGEGEVRPGHPEHYWLCGECSRTRTLTQDAAGVVHLVQRLPEIREPGDTQTFVTGGAF